MRGYTLVSLLVALALAASVAAEPSSRSAEAAPVGTSGGLTDVRFGDHIAHERAVLDFRSAAAPEFDWSYRPGDTVVRVRLPETQAAFVTGKSGLGRAISHYRVVRTKPGWLFVDLHLKGAARSVNVFELRDPGRVVVDVRPGGLLTIPSPARADGTYVMTPRGGAEVGPGEFRVSGYGRPFESTGTWRLENSAGKVVDRGFYTTADWTGAWGTYSFRVAYPERLSGQRGTLEVGEISARDGSFEGAVVPLRFG